MSSRELDELYEYIQARHLPVVLLQVLRRFNSLRSPVQARAQERERVIRLASQLSALECERLHTDSHRRLRRELKLSTESRPIKKAVSIRLSTIASRHLALISEGSIHMSPPACPNSRLLNDSF